jgi:hypothetical protein
MRSAMSTKAVAAARGSLWLGRKNSAVSAADTPSATGVRSRKRGKSTPSKPGSSTRPATTAVAIAAACAIRAAGASAPGRQSSASTMRIGYSAIQEKVKGAMRPAKRPPSMPPKESAR